MENTKYGDRLSEVLEEKGLSAYKLSELTALPQSSISNYRKGKSVPNNITNNVIASKLNVNAEWLLTGDGEKEIKELQINPLNNIEINKAPDGKFGKKRGTGLVPYYEVDFAAGNDLVLVENDKVKPDYYMDIPEFSGCTAFRAYSDSMENLIKSGSILFGTKVDEWRLHLEYGQIYGIICTDGRRYLKYIRREKTNPTDYFLLKSENEMYDDFEMPKEAIRSIWLIHGWLNKRT